MTDASRSIDALLPWLAGGAVDAELAALLAILVRARVPVLVAGGPASRRVELRDALAASLAGDTQVVALAGAREGFEWMPEAVELGWRRERARRQAAPRSTADRTAIVADLDESATGTWGERARIAIRAISVGYDLLATGEGDRLEDVLDRLAGRPVAAAADELARLGLVAILAADGSRVAAVHYLRPVARDAHGHVQRLPPAVVATWDPGAGRFEHFAWGIAAELAARLDLRQTELEREQAQRAQALSMAVETARTTRD